MRLRDELGFPGMVVLQFAVRRATRRIRTGRENHVEQSVVYTGTHDNDTTRRLVGGALTAARRGATGLAGDEPSWELIEVAWRSVAALAIAPLQDVL